MGVALKIDNSSNINLNNILLGDNDKSLMLREYSASNDYYTTSPKYLSGDLDLYGYAQDLPKPDSKPDSIFRIRKPYSTLDLGCLEDYSSYFCDFTIEMEKLTDDLSDKKILSPYAGSSDTYAEYNTLAALLSGAVKNGVCEIVTASDVTIDGESTQIVKIKGKQNTKEDLGFNELRISEGCELVLENVSFGSATGSVIGQITT